MRAGRRLLGASVGIAATLGVVACGGSPAAGGNGTSAGSLTQATAQGGTQSSGGLDPCLVGTWSSTGLSGTITLSDGTTVPLSGGAGTVSTISATGAVHTDYSHGRPTTGTGSDGAAYALSDSGTLTGQLTARDGSATLSVPDPSTATEVVTKNGVTVATDHPPTTSASTYTCTPGSSLSITQAGVTTTWAPQ